MPFMTNLRVFKLEPSSGAIGQDSEFMISLAEKVSSWRELSTNLESCRLSLASVPLHELR